MVWGWPPVRRFDSRFNLYSRSRLARRVQETKLVVTLLPRYESDVSAATLAGTERLYLMVAFESGSNMPVSIYTPCCST